MRIVSPSFLRHPSCISFFLSALVVFHPTLTRAEHYHVVLLGGQSNALGLASTEGGIPLTPADSKIFFFSETPTFLPANAGGAFVSNIPSGSNSFGPEVGIARALVNDGGLQKVLIAKVAKGSTNIHIDWARGSELYNRFINNSLAALSKIEAANDTYTVIGFAWHQGENNRPDTTRVYTERLREFIANIRADLHTALPGKGFDQLPFHIGEVTTNLGTRNLHISDAQLAVANSDFNSYFIPTRTFPQGTDIQHFNSEGMRMLGAAFGASLLQTLGKTSLATTEILDRQPIGTTVGTLRTEISNAPTPLTYSLVVNPDGAFQITGNQLQTAQKLDSTSQAILTPIVRATRSDGTTLSETSIPITVKKFLPFEDEHLIVDVPAYRYEYDAFTGKADPHATYTGDPIFVFSGRQSKDFIQPNAQTPFTVRYKFRTSPGRKFQTGSVLSNVQQFFNRNGQNVRLSYSFDGETFATLFEGETSRTTPDAIPNLSGQTSLILLWELFPGEGSGDNLVLFSSLSTDPGLIIDLSTQIDPASAPYISWAEEIDWQGIPYALRAPNQDADGDGKDNFLEHAFGENPAIPTASTWPILSIQGHGQNQGVTLQFPQAVPAYRYAAWRSGNLLNWTSTGFTDLTLNPQTQLYETTYQPAPGETAQFFQIRISSAQ